MQITLEIADNTYETLQNRGIDIQSEFKEYIDNISDDNYHSITTHEAKQRVSKAVEDYRSGKMQTVPYSHDMDKIDRWLESL